MPLPIPNLTYLGNPDEPSFVVGVPGPNNGTKPVVGSPMMGPLVEFISHFWPLWDNPAVILQDIGIGNTSNIVNLGSSFVWGLAKNGVGLLSAAIITGDDLTVGPITISEGYSLERLYIKAAIWIHEILVNDPDSNNSIQYLNGKAQPVTAYNASTLAISSLITWDGSGLPIPMNLEYARIWDRALTSYEVADLYGNPYIMFGVTQELIDEITTIVNFMKPIRTSWELATE